MRVQGMFYRTVLLTPLAILAMAAPARAEPAIKTILNTLYSGATIKLVKQGGDLDINAGSTFDNLFTGTKPIKNTQGAQNWGINGSGMTGDFDLKAKFATNNQTFGFFNPPSSTGNSPPPSSAFNGIFTVSNSGYDSSLTIRSHLTGPGQIGGNNSINPINPLADIRTNGQAQSSNTGVLSVTGNAIVTPPDSPVFRVTNIDSPFAFGIRSPVNISGSNVNIGTTVTGPFANQFSSVNSQNNDGYAHMLTFSVDLIGGQHLYVIAFEDSTAVNSDFDYNDLVVELNSIPSQTFQLSPTPEPVSVAMFGIGFLGLAGFRLRQKRNAAQA